MAFLKSVAGLLSDLTQKVTGSTPPFQVSEVSASYYQNFTMLIDDGTIKLYQDKSNYKAVLCPNVSKKSFLIFMLPTQQEASDAFNLLSYKLQVLVQCPNLVNVQQLQKVSDIIREHPGYGCAHIISILGEDQYLSKDTIVDSINLSDTATGITPLLSSIQHENVKCIQELMFLGADVRCADKEGCNVFHYAARCQDSNIIQILASKDSSMLNELNKNGESALHEACLHKLPNNVEMLLRWKVDAGKTKSHRYPVHCILQVDCVKSLQVLMRWTPDAIKLRDADGNGALHMVTTKEMVETLLEYGCDIEDRNNRGQTALLMKIQEDNYDACLSLLVSGANAQARDNEDNGALHYAIEVDRPEFVQMLIVFGADVNLCNAQHISPRHKAAASSKPNYKVVLHLLHSVGAVRCNEQKHNCMDGCKKGGSFNGEGEIKLPNKLGSAVDQYGENCAMHAAITRSLSNEGDDYAKYYNTPGDRILCLDGGGIRGLVSIQILMAIENITGRPIHELFDWIGGTSTGGILTVGLLQRKSLNYMLGSYFRLKDQVFKGKRPYNSEVLENFLKKEFGVYSKMGDIKQPKIMLMSVLADRMPAELHIFKNYEIPGVEHDDCPSPFKQFKPLPYSKDQPVWEAVRATGAAPTYFRASGRFIDGGIVANNPTLDVMTEIHKYNLANKATGNSQNLPQMHVVVSVGTGIPPVRFVEDCDVYRPEGIFEFTKVFYGAKNLGELLINQATQSEGQTVSRAAAWCNMIDVPFFRFSPQLSDFIPLDCADNMSLINMLWETQCYLHSHHEKLTQLGKLLM